MLHKTSRPVACKDSAVTWSVKLGEATPLTFKAGDGGVTGIYCGPDEVITRHSEQVCIWET